MKTSFRFGTTLSNTSYPCKAPIFTTNISTKSFHEKPQFAFPATLFLGGAPSTFLQHSSCTSSSSQPQQFTFGSKHRFTCMANPRRVQMVSQQIRREISEMFLHDKVLKDAIVPETALGSDMYLSAVATVSDVEVSGDLQVAKVFISVFGDQRGKEIALENLKKKQGYVRAGLGKRMSLRYTPEVRFVEDDSIERGSRVLSILNKLKEERERREKGEVVLHNVNMKEDDPVETGAKTVVRKQKKKQKGVSPPTQINDTKFVWDEAATDSDGEQDFDVGDDERIIFLK